MLPIVPTDVMKATRNDWPTVDDSEREASSARRREPGINDEEVDFLLKLAAISSSCLLLRGYMIQTERFYL